MVEEPRKNKLEAAGQAASTTGKQRVKDTDVLLPPFYEVQGPNLGNGTSLLWVDLLTSINLIYKSFSFK